ncbi:MAG TPA: HAMP domain-containing sensor histidine kinase, partial [Geminicoccaceae bacterium]|nr:HAMP domain-containing sensor histidine kinase [Geminicoccaceae bacterium]
MLRPPSRLLRTTAFKLALVYLALFSLSAVILLGLIWWFTAGFMQRQTAEVIQAEVQGFAEQYRTAGLPGLRRMVERRAAAEPVHGGIYLLTDTFLQPVAGNVDGWPQVRERKDGWLRFTFTGRGEGAAEPERRQALGKAFRVGPGFHLLVGRDIQDRLRLQATILRAIGWGLGLTLLLGLAGGFLMSRQLLRRVDAINRTTSGIMAGDLSRRIELTGSRDEFDQLAANLNAMLERIERLLEGMRQVTDNIAHDLRTPLNRIRSRIEVALLSEPDALGARELLRATVRDADALIHTVNALLDIAKAEAGGPDEGVAPLDLAAVTRDVAELYQPLAEDKGLAFAVGTDDALPVRAGRHLVAQAVANLLDNAVKYTPAGGRVMVEARAAPAGPTLLVADTGPGIPEDQRERVLERFVRLDTGRSTPGNGLGLSLVRAVARRHGATLRLDDNAPG